MVTVEDLVSFAKTVAIKPITLVLNCNKNVEKLEEKLMTLVEQRQSIQHDVDEAKRRAEEIELQVTNWMAKADKWVSEERKKLRDQLEEKAKKRCFMGLCLNPVARYKLSKQAEEDARAVYQLAQQPSQFRRISYFPNVQREEVAVVGQKLKRLDTDTAASDASTMENFLQEWDKEKPVRYTAQQLDDFTSNYSTRLGFGGYGDVYEGRFPNGVKIAVKLLKENYEGAAKMQFMAEVGTIGRTNHINLVRLYGFCYDRNKSALVYEFMENGSLDNYLFGKKEIIEWEKLHVIAVGTAKGIAYLHQDCQQRIIHYDIKPANILLDADFLPKVADFGLAKLCDRDITHDSVTRPKGTFGYSAPELFLRNHPITYKCDVYSFGMMLFEIVGRRKNTVTSSSGSLDWFPKVVLDKYQKGELAELIKSCGIKKKDMEKAERMSIVALWCVQDSPGARPPMSAVVKMLEGGVEIMPPPRPTHLLFSSIGTSAVKPPNAATSSSSSSSEESASFWYKETTSIIAKYVIEVASS